ncbi:TPA: hypothetical protein EYP13_04980, partial [Candidatus Micrarchaeota archaeon]|nr:hypothetical protein [Candidatus Micrarchaeota archaeon]
MAVLVFPAPIGPTSRTASILPERSSSRNPSHPFRFILPILAVRDSDHRDRASMSIARRTHELSSTGPYGSNSLGMLYAEVDLGRIRKNLERLRELVREVSLLFVVKGDAYGHGLEEVAPATADLVDWFGVESLDEGLLIRSLGLENPILVMVPPPPEDLAEVIRLGFHFVLGDRSLIREAERAAARIGRPAFVHIPVDTGMGRYGFLPEELDGILRELSYCVGIVPVGIYSHLSSAHGASHEDIAFTRAQIDLFLVVLARLRRRGVSFPWVHFANSPGLLS